MKIILIIIFLFVIQNSYSQADAEKRESNKPSWGSKMPTREETPALKFDADLVDEDGIDMIDFGMDRSRLLDSDDSIQVDTSSVSSDDETKEQKTKEEEEIVAAELIAEQNKRVEEEKEAAQLIQEQERKAKEDIAARQLAEKKRKADIQLKEKQRQEEESRVKEKIKEESTQEDLAVQQEPVKKTVVTALDQNQSYSWKKIKNVLPIYPTRAARDKKEGWVEIKITINSDGDVVEAEVVNTYRNYRSFNSSALKAVKKWKYEPPKNYGIESQLSKTVRIVFKL